MTLGLSIAALLAILAGTWFLGFWNNAITLVNTLLAAIIASNFFEPLADFIDGGQSTYTYMLDFVCLWLLFFVSFAVLRAATDLLSRYRLKFSKWMELGGRSVCSLATAWIFLCFMQFTFHTAPFPPGPGNFQSRPDSVNFPLAPDRLWLGFLQSRSRGAMAWPLDAPLVSAYDSQRLHRDDRQPGYRVFDSKADLIYKYHHRRLKLSEQEALRVQR
jgi:hypothetical protein